MIKLKDTIVKAINAQIAMEMANSHGYLCMAVYLDALNHKSAKFYYAQNREERHHARKFIDFLLGLAAKPIIPALTKPDEDYTGLMDVISKQAALEDATSESIYKLYKLSQEEGDNQAHVFLHKFVKIQYKEMEEVKLIQDYAKRLGPGVAREGSLEVVKLDKYIAHLV